MKIKVFKTSETELANDFIKDVDLIGDNPVQVTSDNEIVIFYLEKEHYEEGYAKRVMESLKRNLFHEEMRLISIELEVQLAIRKNEKELIENKEEQLKASKENIELLKKKIAAYEQKFGDN